MKKITLASILIFISITGAIFIGNVISTNIDSATHTPPVKKGADNPIKYQEINDSPDTPTNIATKESTQDNNSSKSKVNHFNDPNLNISQLKFKPETSFADTFTVNEVVKHNTRNDCYLIINNKVYDVSEYISYHPGGSRVITSRCGQKVTGIFARIHSNRAWDLLKKYKIGTITVTQPDTLPQTLNAIKNALQNANPAIDIIKVTPKKHFYVAKLIFDNKLYELHINNSGKIIQEEVADDESNWTTWENDNDDK